jgi:hypothetical protein
MVDDERQRRGGWLWIWIAIFVVAVLLIMLWAWPARRPPATDQDRVGAAGLPVVAVAPPVPPQKVTVSSASAVSAARLERS